MNTIADIISAFDINDTSVLQTDDLLIDLDSDWTDGDSYQIIVNDITREIELNKVSKCGLILFIDTHTNQVTVVSLSHRNC